MHHYAQDIVLRIFHLVICSVVYSYHQPYITPVGSNRTVNSLGPRARASLFDFVLCARLF